MLISKILRGGVLKKRIIKSLKENSGSILRTIIYTIGHFLIAATCVWYFTGAHFIAAITDAIVEPILNAIWYFLLDRYWVGRLNNNNKTAPTFINN